MTGEDLEDLLGGWIIALAAERKSPQTVKIYGDGVHAFLTWCEKSGIEPALDRATVNKFIASLLESGTAAATARSRQLSVRRFSGWLADEEHISRDDLLGLKPPALDTPNVPSLTERELAALLKACDGKTFRDRRDEAIVRLALESAARAEEIILLRVADVDLARGIAVIRRGKGGHGRTVPFGPKTAQAIDRYTRMRRAHRLASTPALWLGDRGKDLGYYGLRNALGARAATAGIEGFHIHRLRHTAASRWLAAGGSEGGLMAVAGWKSRDMLDRYVADTAMNRAAGEARSLNLGDL
jgi:integrase/recombinase XerD